jgi:hypothetical protein
LDLNLFRMKLYAKVMYLLGRMSGCPRCTKEESILGTGKIFLMAAAVLGWTRLLKMIPDFAHFGVSPNSMHRVSVVLTRLQN